MKPATVDTCSDCGRERRRYERWFWIYPDVLPPGPLVPIAKLCRPCGERRGRKWRRRSADAIAALSRAGR